MIRMLRNISLSLLAIAFVGTTAQAQLPTGWRAHDWDRPLPTVVTPGEAALPLAPPSDAIILFDGKDLSQWRDNEGNEAKWIVRDGVMESVPGSGYVFTRKAFGDAQLHVEWASPETVQGSSQGRGNSGVFLMGKFEVQVLDSFENRTYADGQAGSLYGQFPPLVNASRGPGQWQSYDIIFHRPRFGADGKLLSPARLTVLHNGVLVQDHVTALGPTSWLQHHAYEAIPDRLPLSLQDHGNPVRYRNIWIRQLDEQPFAMPTKPYDPQVEELSSDELDKYVGDYGGENGHKILRNGRHLEIEVAGRKLEMTTRSKTEFGVRFTAAIVVFELGEDGRPKALLFEMGGDKRSMKRSEEH
jgi:hypothetical protein